MKKVGTDYDYSLPFEMIYEILSWLPGSDLLRFKCVSKSWYHLINDPKFIKLNVARSLVANSNTSFILESSASQYRRHNHIFSFQYRNRHLHPDYNHVTQLSGPNHGIFEAEPLTLVVVGSCHGLVCFEYVFSGHDIPNRYLIYNPTTRASKILPDLDFIRGYTCILGFGYDSVSDDYKVLTTSKLNEDGDFSVGSPQKSMLYSLKLDAWEAVDNPPWNVTSINYRTPALVNNSFHWLPREGKEIKCFSLSNRSYYGIPIAENILCRPERLCRNLCRMTVFEGQLCVVTSYFDIWMLNEYGNDKSWTQVFRNNESLLIVYFHKGLATMDLRVACFKDEHNNFILLVTHCFGGEPVLRFYCDIASETTKEIEMPSLPAELRLAALQPWVESLVPLH